MGVPGLRVQIRNDAPVRAEGEFVLYWMIAYRRTAWNFSLQRAVEWAVELNRPLVILEALRCDYPYASDRLHAFVLEGMADNGRRLAGGTALYYPYVESSPGAGKGLVEALGGRACVVVTDEFPAFFLPNIVSAAARQLPVRLEQVDSNGLLPLRSADRVFTTAHSFRRFLQGRLPYGLVELPEPDPLQGLELPRLPRLPEGITTRWPTLSNELASGRTQALRRLPIDHSVGAVSTRGGPSAAEEALERFLSQRLPRYADKRNELELDATSGLSPYLHFGHISAHQVFSELVRQEGWSVGRLAPMVTGRRRGWWGMGGAAEAFLDQLVTWRELGFNMCWQRGDYDRYESLPQWAQKTLSEHAGDRRPHIYSLDEFEAARTHDPLWNAAQTQLVREGRIHNYMRMLWGKKILEWTASPQEALAVMIELNNKYALDGRDPNSYSGIFWVLGRYDRPWGPERPVFGKVRYMSSENTARKLRVGDYLRRYAS